jgi:hypothetical protein
VKKTIELSVNGQPNKATLNKWQTKFLSSRIIDFYSCFFHHITVNNNMPQSFSLQAHLYVPKLSYTVCTKEQHNLTWRFIRKNILTNYIDWGHTRQRKLVSTWGSMIVIRNNIILFRCRFNCYRSLRLGLHSRSLRPGFHSRSLRPGFHSRSLRPGFHSRSLGSGLHSRSLRSGLHSRSLRSGLHSRTWLSLIRKY